MNERSYEMTLDEILDNYGYAWERYSENGNMTYTLDMAKSDILKLMLEKLPKKQSGTGGGCYECGWDLYDNAIDEVTKAITEVCEGGDER